MIEYKMKALKRFSLDDRYSRFFKKSRTIKDCHKCLKEIKIGDIYFCHEHVLSYFVDHMYDYHLDCISRDEIIKEINIEHQYLNYIDKEKP